MLRRGWRAIAGSLVLVFVGHVVPLPVHAVTDGLFDEALRFPPELTDDEITLRASEADVQVLPGEPTRMWTFNGAFPGPTIRRPSGEPTQVTVVNDLPQEAGDITIHHHGGHQASEHDGQPGRYTIPKGGSRTYVYEHMEDGAPERAATQWYHDHSHFRTGRNVWMGLAGMFLLTDDFEAGLNLPDGDRDLPLMIADRRFDEDNQLVDPFTAPDREEAGPLEGNGTGWPPFDEVVGDRMLVNGVPEPYHAVEPRKYRLRLLNAGNFRPLNLKIQGVEMVQIGTESGLLPAPVERESILLGPAERAEVVVDFAGHQGEDLVVESVGPPDGIRPATAPARAPVMQFRVSEGPDVDDPEVPDVLRPLPDWVDEASETPDRVWTFGLNPDLEGRMAWTINGRAFDPGRVDARPELGTVETWMFVNTTPIAISHYIHIHLVDFKTLSRNGRPPDPWEDGLKETFRLDPGEVVVAAAKFTDHTGSFMIHCHMLEHEDHGMMTTFEVVEPGQGDRSAGVGTASRATSPVPFRAPVEGPPSGSASGVGAGAVAVVCDQVAVRWAAPADSRRSA